MKEPKTGIVVLSLVMLFLLLKCYGQIDWSMWVVLSPLWVTFLVSFVDAVYEEMKHQNRRRNR
jgi:hypothetical protein